jgi:hypothetical protein
MEVIVQQGIVILSGTLTETFQKEQLLSHVRELGKLNNTVKLSFAALSRANSVGIAHFLSALEDSTVPILGVCCPVWLVEQFNQISEFFDFNFRVESVYAPFVELETGKYHFALVNICEDFIESNLFRDIENPINIDGRNYLPDFERDDYFLFVKSFQK